MALSDAEKLAILSDIAETVAARRGGDPEDSYTARLLARGVEKCAQKTGEEAVEFVIAATAGRPQEIASEAADLLYHLVVTLEATGVSLDDVLDELRQRRGVSGLTEKASRNAG